jgi:hypothetical protein
MTSFSECRSGMKGVMPMSDLNQGIATGQA